LLETVNLTDFDTREGNEGPFPPAPGRGQKGWDLLQRFVELLRGARLFRRRHTSERARALAVLAYHGSLSLLRAGRLLRRRRSHEAIRQWYRQCKDFLPDREGVVHDDVPSKLVRTCANRPFVHVDGGP